jgi:PAT family beta-lactamase induction signal transducer AmpG
LKADWRERLRIALTVYMRPRLLLILALGFASGLPFLITSSTLTVRLRESGIDLGAIGLFSLVGIPYAFKFLWAPLLDLVRPPGFGRKMGLRRSWIFVINVLLIAFIVLLGLIEPTNASIYLIALLALTVSFLSATQDVAIDAYRIELLKVEEYGAGAAMAVYGFRVGMLMATAGTLYLADGFNWEIAYAATGATLLIGVIAICVAPEPPRQESAPKKDVAFGRLVWDAYMEPLQEFVSRRGWLVLLAFVLLFKFGDALLSQMVGALYVDLGFEKSTIATISKLFGFMAILVGTFTGGLLIAVWTMGRVLLLAGILQAISNLGFWHLHQVVGDGGAAGGDAPYFNLLSWVVGFENFASGLSQTAFVAFVMMLCDKRFAATHFAFITSIMAFSPKVMVAPAGFVADWLGWSDFVLLTAFAALPGIALLIWMRSIYPDVWRDQYSKEN